MSHATKISSIQSAQPSRAAAPKSLSQSKRPVWVATTIMIAIFAVFQLSELGRLQAADNGDVIFMSTSSQGSVGGIVYTTEDIIAYDVAAESWSMYFDGSDVTVPADADIGGFAILDDDSLLLTLMQDDVTLPDVGLVDASDIVRFVPTALGETTSGTFEMYFDGSDVNLDGTDEIIDAFAVRTSGQLVISTQGDADVLGFTTADEDALFFTPSQLGTTTTGTWETFYFDGSDVELSDGGEDEDLNALWVKPDTNDSYFSTQGAVSVSGVSGDGSDITLCTVAIAADTSCTSYTLDWDGSAHGLTSQINALHIGPASNLANFTAAPTNGIYPLTVTFTGSSAGADSYLWDFGDGSTSTEITPTHTYGNAGAYTVTLTVTDTGEVDTFTRPGYIAVGNQLQNPDFEWDKLYWSEQGPVTPSSDAYSGSQAVRMGPTESHIWQHPIVVPGHAYVFSGYAKVDASETAAARIGVDFYDANDVLLSGSNTTITSTTYQPFNAFYVAPENASYADVRVWKEAGTAYLYADDLAFTEQANLLQNPDFESGLAHWSDWYDQMALGNDAYDGSQALVIGPDLNAAGQEVIGIPDETYTYSGWAKIDTGEFAKVGIDFLDSSQNILARTSITVTDTVYQSFTLSDTAPANTTAIQVWGWKDDGSGYLYVDTLSLSIGGGITPPQADFTATPVSGTVPLTITFANNSTGAESFLWAFGDGSTSTELLPTHVYTQTGSYTVTLTATGQGGTDSLSRTDYITVIDVDTGDGNLLQNPDFEDGLDSWDTWTGSESVSSLAYSAEQALRIGTAEGAAWQDVSGSSGETYVLGGWAKASDGENAEVGIDFYDAGMNVLDYVYVTITTTTYQPFNVSGVAPANTAYVRAWAWKDAGDDYLYVDDLYLTLGEPTIVQAGFDATPLSGTRPFTVTFSNHSMNAHTYAWDFGDGITSTVSAPTHAYQQAGIYTVSLTATSTSGSDVLNRVRYITVYGSNPDTRVTDGLQALYMFQEGSGTMIHDVSDAGLPLDLTIEDTDAVTWLSGGGLVC